MRALGMACRPGANAHLQRFETISFATVLLVATSVSLACLLALFSVGA
jgi:hypothetical protein